jgi:hypothetical protein
MKVTAPCPDWLLLPTCCRRFAPGPFVTCEQITNKEKLNGFVPCYAVVLQLGCLPRGHVARIPSLTGGYEFRGVTREIYPPEYSFDCGGEQYEHARRRQCLGVGE